MKKDIAGLGIEPQNYNIPWLQIWCLAWNFYQCRIDLLIHKQSKIKHKTTKSAQIYYILPCPDHLELTTYLF